MDRLMWKYMQYQNYKSWKVVYTKIINLANSNKLSGYKSNTEMAHFGQEVSMLVDTYTNVLNIYK